MNHSYLEQLLKQVAGGSLAPADALKKLKHLHYEDLGFAKIDHHRALRNGFPEVIFCQGKTAEQVAVIFAALAKNNHRIIATRANEEMYAAVAAQVSDARYHSMSKLITRDSGQPSNKKGSVSIISAGTADQPVAEEAAICCELMGHQVIRLYDVGVAGIHRLLDKQDQFEKSIALIVVAGMEGALASVVAGLVDKPVIAVPTSVGYGASFNGLSALLAMLNSCATGIGVVNIDNGFGAAALASSIVRAKE
ncbi:nickel pincer cofactor biosynthesis protein LarB [Metallumcola ferriviriculae]|uniref:Nickel pincer cofactor biosynthesis protein LarB n=1 Tax=Metallumcola ferriviriculae TaxID=3039180 RepID=A0AAU0UIF4_9FIRM|nr:nickel pincer cofactor biosynthesis protein LarB [Desulfitibacteraceae bacterium MK1]